MPHFAPVPAISSHGDRVTAVGSHTGSNLNYLAKPAMLIQILSHTPFYVWAILALLVYRGVIAMRTREVKVSKMFIIPVIMLVLSLQDVFVKFGFTGVAFAAWTVAAVATMALVRRFSAARVTQSSTAGSVIVPGSTAPLSMMMAVFATKYGASVAVAIAPHLLADIVFSAALCALFGVLNGYFFGRVARDMIAYHSFSPKTVAGAQAL